MIGTERDMKVRVWDRDVEISVHQKSKSAWIESGTCLGQYMEGSSAGSATKLQVTYRGN